jgi:hypothetical protein
MLLELGTYIQELFRRHYSLRARGDVAASAIVSCYNNYALRFKDRAINILRVADWLL